MGITGPWKGRGGSAQEDGASLETVCLPDTREYAKAELNLRWRRWKVKFTTRGLNFL